MFSLYARHFVDARRDVFQSDLDGKNWVILLEGERAELVGFSTLHLYETRHRGERITVAYSGDTIVEPAAWGSPQLSSFWIGTVNHLYREHANAQGRLFWLLLVSGYRTYRFLPVFWRRFYPRFDLPTPEDTRTLIASLAGERFGDRFDPEQGIVRLGHPPILRDGLTGIPAGRMKDRHVAFFANRNRGHACGDELVCLTELAPENLTAAGRRMWNAGERVHAGREAS